MEEQMSRNVHYVVETRDNQDSSWKQHGSTVWYTEDGAIEVALLLPHYHYRLNTRVVKVTSVSEEVILTHGG